MKKTRTLLVFCEFLALTVLTQELRAQTVQTQAKPLPLDAGELVRACLAVTESVCPARSGGTARDPACAEDVRLERQALKRAITASARIYTGDATLTFSDLWNGLVPVTVHAAASVSQPAVDGSRSESYEIKIVPDDWRSELLAWQTGGPGRFNFYAFPADFLGCRVDILRRADGAVDVRVQNSFYEDHPTPAGPLLTNDAAWYPRSPEVNRPEGQLIVNGTLYKASSGYAVSYGVTGVKSAAARVVRDVLALFGKTGGQTFRASSVFYGQ